MTPFLQQVASVYADREAAALYSYCFVFPNKRSGTFFANFLKRELPAGSMFPRIMTISEFVGELSDATEANRYEQLFTLYNEYCLQPGVDVDFDRFLFWGEMLIGDFNDVDRYLVDAEALFVNVKRLREISANYLTEEQLEVIRRYWGEERPGEYIDRFWNHIDRDGVNKRQQAFVKLWEVLLPLYNGYRRSLSEQGLATQGMLYRNAVDVLSDGMDRLPYSRCVFVGFNVLSTSEIKIFSILQRRGAADFYWDFDSPAFNHPDNKAGRFLRRNMREFPSRYNLKGESPSGFPHITVLGVPSGVGQVKAAGKCIEQWIQSGAIADKDNAIDTAVVLPDESLFIPMIHSVPTEVGAMNVTMGFPMRLSPVSALMRNIVSLQLRSRVKNGIRTFFYDDVATLLASPFIRSVDAEGCDNLAAEIQQRRLFQIPAPVVAEKAPALVPVFASVADMDDMDCVAEYVDGLCDFVSSALEPDDRMQRHFVDSYRQAVDALFDASKRFGISMRGNSFFHLIERAINGDTVSFVGEPLKGLQVMGVLETRALDFDNVVMLSMNERVFPRKHYTRSFIPDALRHGYGMATIDFQESIFAYYFYRLISRARNVTLIYDARTVGGTKSSELSRYIAQLLYLFPDADISHRLAVYSTRRYEFNGASARKDARVMGLLENFTKPGGRNLSASAINTYISCPLEFYLQYVEGYNVDDDVTDYMDASTYGTILHEVAQKFYQQFQGADPDSGVVVTPELIDRYLEHGNTCVDRLVTESINRNYNKLPDDRVATPLVGESLVLGRVIRHSILAMLRCDRELAPFTFMRAEKTMEGQLKITDSLSVNVKQVVDRIDMVDGTMRFVDYKTGVDELKAPSVESLFDTANPNRAKAIMQLMFYCHVYREVEGSDQPIMPAIYKMRTILPKGLEPLKIGGDVVADYHQWYEEFVDALNSKILEIFNPDVPFTRAPSDRACKFCKFKAICDRESATDDL